MASITPSGYCSAPEEVVAAVSYTHLMVAFGSRKYSSKLMQDYRNGNRLESKMPKDKGPKRVPWIDRVATPQNLSLIHISRGKLDRTADPGHRVSWPDLPLSLIHI